MVLVGEHFCKLEYPGLSSFSPFHWWSSSQNQKWRTWIQLALFFINRHVKRAPLRGSTVRWGSPPAGGCGSIALDQTKRCGCNNLENSNIQTLLRHSEAVDSLFLEFHSRITLTYAAMKLRTSTRPEHMTKSFKDHDPPLHPPADIQLHQLFGVFHVMAERNAAPAGQNKSHIAMYLSGACPAPALQSSPSK